MTLEILLPTDFRFSLEEISAVPSSGDEVKIAIPDCVKTSAADFFDQTSAAIQYLLNLESNGLKTRLEYV